MKVEEEKNGLLLAHQSMLLEGGLTDCLDDMYIMKATADPDTLYYHETMKEPDPDRFKEAMVKEWVEQDNYRPDRRRGLEIFVDADFAGNYPDTARSRHRYIICYAGLPIVRKSQLQTEIALSTTEAEYIGLSHSHLIKEMSEKGSLKYSIRTFLLPISIMFTEIYKLIIHGKTKIP